MERYNLEVFINPQVTKLLPTKFSTGVPSFRAVQAPQCEGGQTPIADLHIPIDILTRPCAHHKEIVLSAGAFWYTSFLPALVQLSGIGDEEELRAASLPS